MTTSATRTKLDCHENYPAGWKFRPVLKALSRGTVDSVPHVKMTPLLVTATVLALLGAEVVVRPSHAQCVECQLLLQLGHLSGEEDK